MDAQTVRRGTMDPQSLDPHRSAYLFEQSIENDMYEGLVVLSPSSTVAAGAAKSWEISSDGRVYSFHLRPGVYWSDGDPLTAKDFVYSFRRLIDPHTKSPCGSLATPIKNADEIRSGKNPHVEQLGVEAVGFNVVRIELNAPTPYFLASLTNACFSPVSKKAVEQSGGELGGPRTSVSNGPYILSEWTHGQRVVLKKNLRYWNAARVAIAEVEYLSMPDVSQEFQQYLAGKLDITWDVPAEEIPLLSANHSAELKVFPYFGDYQYVFDMTRAPFRDNPKLRQALAMAIDREAITQKITGGGELPAYGWVPPGLSGYDNQTVEWKELSRDGRLARARSLYAEAGYGAEKPLKLIVHGCKSEVRRKMCDAVIHTWAETLGVEASATAEPFTTASKDDDSLGHIGGLGWNADYPDANSFLEIWKSDSSDNNSGYSNQEFDALLSQAARATSAVERARLLAKAERVLIKDMPGIPIYDSVLKKMVRASIHGYSPNVLGYAYSKDLWISQNPAKTIAEPF
jgi:oligopeptide transport system substrate-binding protein